MSWSRVELGKVCSKIGSGATPKGGKSVYIDFGVHQIRSQNIHNLQFDYGGLACITNDAANKLSSVMVEPRDVLLNITGDSVARVCQVPENVLPARVNQHVAIVRPENNQIRPEFLVYYLASPLMQSCMLQLANGKGASRNALTKEMIAAFEVPCPPLEIQDAIVDVLSVYDNLIENNRRQIKLLEEAAQRLYREWFVFNSEVNSWPTKSLLSVTDIVRGRSYTSANLVDNGSLHLVNLNNIRAYGGWTDGADKPYNGDFKPDQIIHSGDILMAVTDMTKERRLVGHVAITPSSVDGALISMDLIKLVPKKISNLYLYATLRFSGLSHYAAMLANGTNVLHLKPEALVSVDIPIPSDELQNKFAGIAEAILTKVETLRSQINMAQEARNRLLPKLMSGEIEA